MKYSIVLTFAISTIFLAGCCTTPHVTKWEYKVEDSTLWPITGTGPQAWRDGFTSHLNELGKDGWVLIQKSETAVFFKRPIR